MTYCVWAPFGNYWCDKLILQDMRTRTEHRWIKCPVGCSVLPRGSKEAAIPSHCQLTEMLSTSISGYIDWSACRLLPQDDDKFVVVGRSAWPRLRAQLPASGPQAGVAVRRWLQWLWLKQWLLVNVQDCHQRSISVSNVGLRFCNSLYGPSRTAITCIDSWR